MKDNVTFLQLLINPISQSQTLHMAEHYYIELKLKIQLNQTMTMHCSNIWPKSSLSNWNSMLHSAHSKTQDWTSQLNYFILCIQNSIVFITSG